MFQNQERRSMFFISLAIFSIFLLITIGKSTSSTENYAENNRTFSMM